MQLFKSTRTTLILFTVGALFVILWGDVQGQAFSRRNKSVEVEERPAASLSAQQSVYVPELPATLEFAGEKIPLENFDTRESLERELTVNMFWHSQMLLIIKQTSRYFPLIEAMLKSNRIPDDFKYLCVAESGLQQVTSPAGAVGFWQLMPATGKELGLEINSEVDERYHIEKS
ncbi:MAG: transglycosylase SLT domain-containing protein, partial [Prevotellaceae bacterium]|nr:transglycosylase SLT domain-containing protein [Prevotellaceae bacterium]